MERVFNMEIEGLMVAISYEFEEGDKGDYYTPPTSPHVTITGWELRDEHREDYLDYDNDEWEDWMSDIDKYVYNESMWDIIEWEESIRDEY